MTPRYIVLTDLGCQQRLDGRWSNLFARAERLYGLRPVFDQGHLIVLATADTPVIAIGDAGGVVVGHLFRRDAQAASVRARDPMIGALAVETAGMNLIAGAWGGYIAVLAGRSGGPTQILRDPSGAVPCFHGFADGWGVAFSDLEPVLGLGLLHPVVDVDFLAHYLTFNGLRTERTGLRGVSEVLAGTRVRLEGGGSSVACCWNPWTFADRAAQLDNRDEAVSLVRAETERCVKAWASPCRSLLLELSGGLDSSIVAICLAGQSAAVSCVNLVTPDPGADERRYAERVAAVIGAPLRTIGLAAETVDLLRPPQAPLPRPGLGALQQVVDQALMAAARDTQIDAFVGGGGGDNVFCSLSTAAPALDAGLMRGPSRTFIQALDNLSLVHECTVWRAAWFTLKKGLRGPAPLWRRDSRFLHKSLASVRLDPHPWLRRPAGALPGKIEHIANLMHIQTAPDGKERPVLAPVRHPLLSQPLVELCLRIPSWMWIEGGLNRSVARDAFKDRLPPSVAARRSKGDFVAFTGSIFARNRQRLKDHLVGGWLDGAGLIDRDAVETYLAQTGPPRDHDYARLLEIAAVETWARSWPS